VLGQPIEVVAADGPPLLAALSAHRLVPAIEKLAVQRDLCERRRGVRQRDGEAALDHGIGVEVRLLTHRRLPALLLGKAPLGGVRVDRVAVFAALGQPEEKPWRPARPPARAPGAHWRAATLADSTTTRTTRVREARTCGCIQPPVRSTRAAPDVSFERGPPGPNARHPLDRAPSQANGRSKWTWLACRGQRDP